MIPRTKWLWSCAALGAVGFAAAAWAAPLGTGITYQGELLQAGAAYTGTADLRLRLWDSAAGGLQVSGQITRACVNVQNGLFTLQDLDFGVDAFDGQNVYLEIQVRAPCAVGVYVTLAPRQRIAPAPYALQTRGLFVDNALNVGIGTVTPAERLEVDGNVLVTGQHAPVPTGTSLTVNDGNGAPAAALTGSATGTSNDIRLYRGGQLASSYDAVSEGTQLRIQNTATGATVLAGGASIADGSGFWEAYGRNGARTVWLDADNDQDPNNGILSGALQIRSTGTGGAGGELNIQNNTGVQTVRLLGGTTDAGGTMTFTNGAATPVNTIQLLGDSGDAGLIQMRNAANAVTVQIDSDALGGAQVSLENDASQLRLSLDGDNSDGGAVSIMAADGSATLYLIGESDFNGGVISVRNNDAEETIRLRGDNGNECSRIALFDREGANSFPTVFIDAVDTAGTGAELVLRDNEGNTTTVELNGENGIGGSLAGELTIREIDGSNALRFLGETLTLYNASGTATITYNRATGTKSAVVETDQLGPRLVYCMESPEVWFEDFGAGQLEGGESYVPLDETFLETVTISEEHPFKVFITLTDECRGVYVRKVADGFTVHELDGGTSDATFDYRVVAKRRGLEDRRFEPFLLEEDADAAFAPLPQTADDTNGDAAEESGGAADDASSDSARPLPQRGGSDARPSGP